MRICSPGGASPKWRSRRTPEVIEDQVAAQRRLGLNRYEIHAALRELREQVPSLSTIHCILVRHGLNRKTPAMKDAKRRIIKERLGELGHIDLHQLPQDIFLKAPAKPVYVISLIDSVSCLAWAEVVASKTALPVIFKALKIINTLNVSFGLQFEAIMTDNGAEFVARTKPEEHPFEVMLLELGIKHRYIRPYKPQTNGKIERFWLTLDDDLIDGTTFDDLDQFQNELFDYIVYYNRLRPHQAIQGLTPNAFAETKIPSPNK